MDKQLNTKPLDFILVRQRWYHKLWSRIFKFEYAPEDTMHQIHISASVVKHCGKLRLVNNPSYKLPISDTDMSRIFRNPDNKFTMMEHNEINDEKAVRFEELNKEYIEDHKAQEKKIRFDRMFDKLDMKLHRITVFANKQDIISALDKEPSNLTLTRSLSEPKEGYVGVVFLMGDDWEIEVQEKKD